MKISHGFVNIGKNGARSGKMFFFKSNHRSRHLKAQMKFFSKKSRGNTRRETGYLGSTGGRIKFK